MRFNMFVQQDGSAYGALVCSVCNKNVTFEAERQTDLATYGEGSRVITMLGSPKPPNRPRQKGGEDSALNDQTL
jgi:hypothetical protein